MQEENKIKHNLLCLKGTLTSARGAPVQLRASKLPQHIFTCTKVFLFRTLLFTIKVYV